MKKLEAAEFDLQKIEFNSKKGVSISFWEKGNGNDLFMLDSDSAPHPDLTAKLTQFRELFAISMETLAGWEMARENTRKNEELLRECVRGYNDEIEKYTVSSINLVGKNEYFGIKIKGARKTESGTVAMTSPTIRFEDADGVINASATDLFDELQNEVYLYVYRNKKAQLDIFASSEPRDESGLNNIPTMSKVG